MSGLADLQRGWSFGALFLALFWIVLSCSLPKSTSASILAHLVTECCPSSLTQTLLQMCDPVSCSSDVICEAQMMVQR